MPTFSIKQSGYLPCILRLPDEILEEIFPALDEHVDLVAFGLASRMCSALVTPHHTQYRILRVRHTLPNVWAHLARRSDLARNIREVHICDEKNKWAPERYPTTLIDSILDRRLENAEESVRIGNLCKALSHMRQLHTLTWSWNNGQRPTSHPKHENTILTTLSQLPHLNNLTLSGKFAMHALSSTRDPESLTYPAWRLSNLRSLSLQGESWAKKENSKHLLHLLRKSPNLECLEVPTEFHDLAECQLPKLRKLKLVVESGIVSIAIDRSRTVFLENHPSIEELVWDPFSTPRIAPDALPNLKCLQTNHHLLTALSDADAGTPYVGLMSPPSTPVTAVTPVPDEPTPVPSRIRRPIESLSVYCVYRPFLEAKLLQPELLRALQVSVIVDLSIIKDIAETFPNIEWLSLPATHIPAGIRSVPITKEQWLDVLPRFKKLQVFRGLGLWQSVCNDRQKMHEVIADLVQTCPQLRALDRVNKQNLLDPYNEISISRDDGHVDYSVKPLRRSSFDTMQQRVCR